MQLDIFTSIYFRDKIQADSIEPGGSAMAVSRAQQKAVNKYVKENYDRINITMPKGKKDAIQAHAVRHGLSVTAYINAAIDEKMAKDDTEAK